MALPSCPLAVRSVPMVGSPEIELNLPLSPDYPIAYVSLNRLKHRQLRILRKLPLE